MRAGTTTPIHKRAKLERVGVTDFTIAPFITTLHVSAEFRAQRHALTRLRDCRSIIYIDVCICVIVRCARVYAGRKTVARRRGNAIIFRSMAKRNVFSVRWIENVAFLFLDGGSGERVAIAIANLRARETLCDAERAMIITYATI